VRGMGEPCASFPDFCDNCQFHVIYSIVLCFLSFMYFISKNFWFTIHMDSWFWRIIDRICLGWIQLGLHKRRLWYNFSSYVGRTELCIWMFVSRTEIRTLRYHAHHVIFLKRGIAQWCPLRIPLQIRILQTRDPKTCNSLKTPHSID